MSYTANKNSTSDILTSTFAVRSIGAWTVAPCSYQGQTGTHPNLFTVYTSNMPDPAISIRVFDGSQTPPYQQSLIWIDTYVIPPKRGDGHKETSAGLYELAFGPTSDLIFAQVGSTKSNNVEVFVLNSQAQPQTNDGPYQTGVWSGVLSPTPGAPGQGFTTPIPLSGVGDYIFRVGAYVAGTNSNDLYCIKTANTTDPKTNPNGYIEIGVLSGWVAGQTSGTPYTNWLLPPTQVAIPNASFEGFTSNANDYRWMVSSFGGNTSGATVYCAKVRNLDPINNPNRAVEIYKVDFTQKPVAQLALLGTLPIQGFYDADYTMPGFHWLMSEQFGLYGINTHNADNPDKNNVDVWNFSNS